VEVYADSLFRGLGAPDALLGVERGEHYGFVVDAGGVAVDGGGCLGAEVAVADVEVKSADVVGAPGAGEFHAALDASDSVVALHSFQCSPLLEKWNARRWGSEGNEWGRGRVSVLGIGCVRSGESLLGASRMTILG
jgi:hypothetical protein